MIVVGLLFEMGRLYAWNYALLFQFVFALLGSSVSVRQSEIVQLTKPNSKIQGKTYTFEDGREASAFLGIPYAQPPVGKLRFKRPLPIGHWLGVKQADKFGHRCYYATYQDYGIKPSEDCLFLNVFVPGSSFKKREELLPIAFYIHGGAFQTDNAQLLGDENICRYLNSKDVIVVTLNYRLQFFGFLAIDENTPGNMGLWDMAEALQFIRNNAKAFGGDTNRITVFGQSAGSMATDLFTISPHTRDLFDRAIMFAGTKYIFFSVSNQSVLRQNALTFAEKHGFRLKSGLTQKEENERLLKFFEGAPPENITIGWYPVDNTEAYLTSPAMDDDFFPKPLEELRKEAPKKQTISGVTEFEGLLFLTGKPKNVSVYDYVKYFLVSSHFSHPQINGTVADAILQTFVNMSLPQDSLEFYKQCTTVFSDFLFDYPTYKMVKIRVGLGETAYLYRFTYFKPGTLGNSDLVPFKAATHTLELPYVFGKSILVFNFVPDANDKQKIEEFTTKLTNFMKTGNPGNEWQPYDLKGHNSYYWFGQDSTQDGMYSDFCGDRMLKWEQLYKKYGIEC